MGNPFTQRLPGVGFACLAGVRRLKLREHFGQDPKQVAGEYPGM